MPCWHEVHVCMHCFTPAGSASLTGMGQLTELKHACPVQVYKYMATWGLSEAAFTCYDHTWFFCADREGLLRISTAIPWSQVSDEGHLSVTEVRPRPWALS